MRGLVYACALLGMLLAAGSIAEYYGLLRIHTVPHLEIILLTDAAAFVVLGLLMYRATVRRERRATKEAMKRDEQNRVAERIWRRWS